MTRPSTQSTLWFSKGKNYIIMSMMLWATYKSSWSYRLTKTEAVEQAVMCQLFSFFFFFVIIASVSLFLVGYQKLMTVRILRLQVF